MVGDFTTVLEVNTKVGTSRLGGVGGILGFYTVTDHSVFELSYEMKEMEKVRNGTVCKSNSRYFQYSFQQSSEFVVYAAVQQHMHLAWIFFVSYFVPRRPHSS